MRITERDRRLVRTMTLLHAMSRDQILGEFFGSVTRCNSRVRALAALGLVRRLRTPLSVQGIYAATPKAAGIVGERLAPLAAARTGSPRFLRHALFLNEIRAYLLRRGASWRFEQQASASFRHGGRDLEVRPDGLAVFPDRLIAVEADMGHVSIQKFDRKLAAYAAWASSGECLRQWGREPLSVLVVTSGPRRAQSLSRLLPDHPGLDAAVRVHDSLGIGFPDSIS